MVEVKSVWIACRAEPKGRCDGKQATILKKPFELVNKRYRVASSDEPFTGYEVKLQFVLNFLQVILVFTTLTKAKLRAAPFFQQA